MKYLLTTLTLLFIYSCGSGHVVEADNDASLKVKVEKKASSAIMAYPKTMEKTVEDNYHGTIVKDNYRWLEDDNSKDVKSWTKAQNAFTKASLNPEIKAKIAKRYKKLFNYAKYNSVMKKGDYYFYYKNDGLQAQSVFYRTKKIGEKPEVVIDPNKLSKDGTTSLGAVYLTKDATLMAYGLSEGGKDSQTYYIKDLKTGKVYPEKLINMRHSSIAWNGNKGFYYGRYPDPKTVKKGEATFNHKLYYHKLGDTQDKDTLIYEDKENKRYAFAPMVTEDGKYLLIYVWQGTSHNTMIYYKNLGTGEVPTHHPNKQAIHKLFDKFEASYDIIGNIGDTLYILTDNKAAKKRIIKLNILDKEKKQIELIKEDKEKIIKSAFISNNSIVVNYMKDVHSEISIFDLAGKFAKDIKLPTVGSARINGRQNNDKIFISFTSFLYPGVIYDYDFKNNKLNEMFKTKLDFKKDNFEAKQIFYTSKDGTKIPMFIVHKKGIKLDGNNPTLLYGYGGFNISLTPWFSTIRLLWMENGGVFAVANLRGGGEYGEEWHKNGMLAKKQNTFDDFIAGSQYLIDNKYTKSKKLAIMGGSNGGLLVAAVMTQKPELFGAVICSVPLTDMLRFHKFLVGHYWTVEYGNAEKSKTEFDYIYKYSPYQHVKKVDYPATLVMTADSDDRVAPLHARKFAAILQKNNTSKNPILLRVEKKAGHGHGKSTEQIIDTQSDLYTFLFGVFGMDVK